MRYALTLAEKARAINEVPVGAVIVKNGCIVGEGFNNPGTLPSPNPLLVPKPSNIAKCTSCGSDLRPNAKFCTNCGSKT